MRKLSIGAKADSARATRIFQKDSDFPRFGGAENLAGWDINKVTISVGRDGGAFSELMPFANQLPWLIFDEMLMRPRL